MGEACTSCSLVDDVLAGQEDVVATPHSLQDRAAMNFHCRGGHDGEESLQEGETKGGREGGREGRREGEREGGRGEGREGV